MTAWLQAHLRARRCELKQTAPESQRGHAGSGMQARACLQYVFVPVSGVRCCLDVCARFCLHVLARTWMHALGAHACVYVNLCSM